MKGTRLPKNIIEKIIKLYQNGLVTRDIAYITGVSKSAVHYHVNEDSKKKTLSEGKRARGQRLSDEDKTKIEEMLLSGCSSKEVRKETGISFSTIKKFRNPENHNAYLEKRKNYIKNRDISGHFKTKRGNKCELCGYERHPKCLDFHHIDPSKKLFEISKSYMRPMPVIEEEASKCILVCKNCHALIHAGIIQIPIDQTACSH
jgi:hypothetical protein